MGEARTEARTATPNVATTAAVAPTSAPAAQRMSRVDTAWLRMDNEVNRMAIVGVWLLRPGLSREALVQRVTERLLAYRRFGQRVVEDALGARWVDDPRLDLDHHVRTHRLRVPRAQTPRQALQRFVADLAMRPLDRRRPLWQFHLIDDFEGGSALVARVHHCIGDGIALISVMLSLTDGGEGPPRRAAARGRKGSTVAGAPGPVSVGPFDPAFAAVRRLEGVVEGLLDRVAHGGMQALGSLMADPLQLPALWARGGAQAVQDAAALALMPDDSPTRLKGRPAGRKRVAWCEPLPLDRVKAVGRALDCSINDVLLSCVAGALGDWLRRQGDEPEGCEIRAMVPVNLRPMSEAWQLGNRFGLVPLLLPIGLDHPLERLHAVRERMAALKGSYQPLMAFALLAAAGLLVKPAQDALLDVFARKATAVMTNVPGPREILRLCGSRLEQTLFWVPQSGPIGVGVSVLSYAGGVQFGLITDQAFCDDPQAVVDRFEPEFEQLLYLALMGVGDD